MLKKRGTHRNFKTFLHIMEKYGLLAEIRRRRKWVTGISYIHKKQGVLYLSVIRDPYDSSIVAYKTGIEQTINLVLDTIRLALCKGKKRAAAEMIDRYIYFYNHERIQLKTGVAPLALRHSA